MSQSSSIEQALSRYEKCRIDRTQVIQSRSRLAEMRYYEADRETSSRPINERSSQTTNDEFQDWLYNYKPSRGR